MAKILALGLSCSFMAIAGHTLHPTIASAEDAPKPQIRKRVPIRVLPPPPAPEPESSDQEQSAETPVRTVNRRRVAVPLPEPVPSASSASQDAGPVARVDRRNLGKTVKAAYYCTVETSFGGGKPKIGANGELAKPEKEKSEFTISKVEDGTLRLSGSGVLMGALYLDARYKFRLNQDGDWLELVVIGRQLYTLLSTLTLLSGLHKERSHEHQHHKPHLS